MRLLTAAVEGVALLALVGFLAAMRYQDYIDRRNKRRGR
jgi:hypothetical protein